MIATDVGLNNTEIHGHLAEPSVGEVAVHQLTEEHREEVLSFLSERPLHTAIMTGWIRDNGMVSPFNRGTFYACRNVEGHLEGVALIGHVILFECCSDAALIAFARVARQCRTTHMLMAEQELVEKFWQFYSQDGQRPRLVCRELLFEQRWPILVRSPIKGLRKASMRELHLIMPVQAAMAYEESGVNPMEKDPHGFRQRCARRIEQGRTWVWIEKGRLLFKAEIVSETEKVAYLEGIWVNPEERGKGYGLRCMAQLGRTLLQRTNSISVLVNEQNQSALRLYHRAGFKLRGSNDILFLTPESFPVQDIST
jgi:predicted GNAT family acetyltransferase